MLNSQTRVRIVSLLLATVVCRGATAAATGEVGTVNSRGGGTPPTTQTAADKGNIGAGSTALAKGEVGAVNSRGGAVRQAQAPGGSPPTTQTAGTLAELRGALNAFLAEPRFAGAMWGVKIASLDSGRTLFERDASRRLSPASNSKLYTAALALHRLGGDHRIVTPILGTSAVGADGELRGDLVVSGRGDPSWNPRRDKQEFWTVFAPFVAAVRQTGVQRINGDVIADATYLRSTPQGAGWTADDLNDYYGAEISAISLEENYVDITVRPGAKVGDPCTLELRQPLTGLEFDNRTTTAPEKSKARLQVLRLPGESRVVVFGSLPLGGKAEETEATVPRPAAWFATCLREALIRGGIEVTGRARGVRWPEASAVTPAVVKLGEVTSPPLRELVSVILKVSQNLRTDLLFAYLGEMQRKPDTPAWRTSDELGVKALNDFLREESLHSDDVIFDEGSGLSRNNLTTARATVSLLQFMAKHRERDAFMAALPVAGVDGTLRKRMKGTPAEGNVRAKTGTLRWANSLSGYVTTAGGEPLVFSLMLNRNVAQADRSSREDIDDIAVMLAQYRGTK